MGICSETNHKYKQRNSINKLRIETNQKRNTIKSLCYIKISNKKFSGFFLEFNAGAKGFLCLIINGSLIPTEIKGQTMTIFFRFEEIKEKVIYLNSNERLIKNFNDIGIDVTVIQILPIDNIPNIYFLNPDMIYINDTDKLIYKNIWITQYSNKKFDFVNGKISKINKYEFNFYKIDNNEDSSGSPIFLCDSINVIGIHKGITQGENCGIFIGPIFNQLNKLIQTDDRIKIYSQKQNSNIFSQSYINAILHCFCNIK